MKMGDTPSKKLRWEQRTPAKITTAGQEHAYRTQGVRVDGGGGTGERETPGDYRD